MSSRAGESEWSSAATMGVSVSPRAGTWTANTGGGTTFAREFSGIWSPRGGFTVAVSAAGFKHNRTTACSTRPEGEKDHEGASVGEVETEGAPAARLPGQPGASDPRSG